MFRRPNVIMKKGKLIATKMIRAGESIRLVNHEPLRRSKEERREIDRLAKMAREHAFRN